MAATVVQDKIPRYDTIDWTGNNLSQVANWKRAFNGGQANYPARIEVANGLNYLVARVDGQDLWIAPTDRICRSQDTGVYFKVSAAEYAARYQTI